MDVSILVNHKPKFNNRSAKLHSYYSQSLEADEELLKSFESKHSELTLTCHLQ